MTILIDIEGDQDECIDVSPVGFEKIYPETNTENTNTNIDHEKLNFIKMMRLKFCIRPDFEITKNIIFEDGSLNQDYFRPKKNSIMKQEGEQRKWLDSHRLLLIKGIEKWGIGHFREISDEFLPDWQPNDLRIKAMRLIGRQNLQLYKDWKGNEDDLKREYEKNKGIGLKYNSWRGNCLVYDDDGKVLEEIKRVF
ncbi:hypothetical protein HK099_004608 [Clydaea vesicula]|uniref:Uncharacterized protein n=1 Tax=Clydaea vesicula TaxID=447962 RepID=A0AAD5XYJ9_9FUNG|nr:hypothetical protein HK099_004608 [Clydaea vesicula]